MDGHFVPNLTMGPDTVAAVRRVTRMPIDAHLMIEDPDAFIERFAAAGATHISVHAEAARHLNRTLGLIRSCGAHPGVALGPASPLELIDWSLEYADYVLLLAVNPGFGGQDYIPNVLDKVRALRSRAAERGLSPLVESDGGINARTIAEFSRAGVDVLVMGSAIFESRDYGAAIADLRRAAEGAA
jgi:ribulose-phosphate 3-epimerase